MRTDAAKGSILGNVNIPGTFDVNSVITAGGSIGNPTTGTGMYLRDVYGIIAAKGSVTIKRSGSLASASIFQNVGGSSDPNAQLTAAAIDAVFTSGGNPVTSLDVNYLDGANLATILANLKRLRTTTGSGGVKVLTDS